jgi:hypothetical protein
MEGGAHLGDAVHHKAALGVIHQAKVLVCLLNLHDVHEARRVGVVCPDLCAKWRATPAEAASTKPRTEAHQQKLLRAENLNCMQATG